MGSAASTEETVVNFPAPCTEPSQATAPDEAKSPRPDPGRAAINILIVDDEPKNLIVLEAILENPAYRLIKAESADQALLALLVDQFALLILDIRMPGVSGIELAHMVKERKKTAQIPIIFLTAYYNEDQHVLEGYGAGAVDYLHKPVNADILRSKVAVFAELYRMQREIKFANHALLAEVSERRRAQDQLRELNITLEQRVIERTHALRTSTALLQAATDNASVGLSPLDGNRRFTFVNPAYCRIFGLPIEAVGKPLDEALSLKDAQQLMPLLGQAFAGERATCELTRLSAGSTFGKSHYSVVCEPERDSEGNVVGVVMVVFDITDRKRSEEHISLLLSEVNHRSKNMLSVVSAIARQTKAPSQEEFVKRFSDRVQALAASHDLLARSEWHSIAFSELLRVQLAHFGGLIGRRILLDGPPMELSVAGAQCIGMVIHELATNAAKHGALSNQEGSVEITWQVKNAADDRFLISWIERGGPPVVPTGHRGFGSTVIKSMVELSLDGQVQLDFSPCGLCWRLECPTQRLLINAGVGPTDESTGS